MAAYRRLVSNRDLRHSAQRTIVAWHLNGSRSGVVVEAVCNGVACHGSKTIASPIAVGGNKRCQRNGLLGFVNLVRVRFALLLWLAFRLNRIKLLIWNLTRLVHSFVLLCNRIA